MNLFSKTKDENIFLSQYSSNEIKKNINKSGKFIGLRT
jgi:hypothetical protein